MDVNCDSLPSTPIAIKFYLFCKSKAELQKVIVRDHSEHTYDNFLKSLCPFFYSKGY